MVKVLRELQSNTYRCTDGEEQKHSGNQRVAPLRLRDASMGLGPWGLQKRPGCLKQCGIGLRTDRQTKGTEQTNEVKSIAQRQT